MKNLLGFLLGGAQVSALSGGKVAELLQFFESNQARYTVNVEQYCSFGDLPLMEMTEYSCLDVIEDSLTDGKTCGYSCKNDASIVGEATCICDNKEGAVTEKANCKWKFPSYSSECGPARVVEVDQKLDDLESENQQRESEIAGVDLVLGNLQGTIDEAHEAIADVDATIINKHAEAIQAIVDESVVQNTARAALEVAVNTDITDLQAANLALETVVTGNGEYLAGVIELTDAHAEQLQVQKQNITEVMQTLASQTISIMSLETELDQETGNLLSALNTQITKQETDRVAMQDEITDNLNHLDNIDDIMNNALLQTKSDLADEVMRGAVRDTRLDGNDEQFDEVQDHIDSNHDAILTNQADIMAQFLFLHNYTDSSIVNLRDQVASNLATVVEIQDAANDALAATDAAITVSLNKTQTDLDEEETRGDAQDDMLAAHGDELIALAADIATNVNGINAVQTNLDHEVEKLYINLNLTEVKLQGNIDQLESNVLLADQDLQNQLDTTSSILNNTRVELAAEIARGEVRDTRLDGHDDEIHVIHDDIEDINEELDDLMAAMKANDTMLQDNIDANYLELTTMINDQGDELRAVDSKLNDTDNQIIADLAATNVALDAEVVRGEGRDETLSEHHDRLVAAEVDLLDKQEQINNLTDVVEENHADVLDRLNQTRVALETAMAEMEEELQAVDAALMDEDVRINERIDDTNAALAVETSRNDDQDTTLTLHTNTLNDHTAELAKLDEDIQTVQSNLDAAVVAIGETIMETKTELETAISDLESDMIEADEELTEETERLQNEIDETNDDVAVEKAKGELRDGSLNDHNVRITILRTNTDTNTDNIYALDNELDDKFKQLNDDLRNTTNTLNDKIYETDRRLTFADSVLRTEDTKIRSEMSQQKYNMETKMAADIETTDRSIRNHFANEIYRTDNKLTNSVNALSVKQQEDVNDIHAALDFFWHIYRPTKVVLFEGIFHPQIGHLVSIIPHVYRIWQVEVDIMPYKKNHYSWVNLLHFTASGDNYGRPGDRMPLVSFYPGENILHIACYINNEVSYAYDSDYVLPTNRWTKLTIGQAFVQGQYVYYVKINSKQVYSVINHYPMDFSNMMVYASDPWTELPNAKLRNLIFTTSFGGSIISRLDPIGGYSSDDGPRSLMNGTAPATETMTEV